MPKDRYYRRPTIGNVNRSALEALSARDTEALAQPSRLNLLRSLKTYCSSECAPRRLAHSKRHFKSSRALRSWCRPHPRTTVELLYPIVPIAPARRPLKGLFKIQLQLFHRSHLKKRPSTVEQRTKVDAAKVRGIAFSNGHSGVCVCL